MTALSEKHCVPCEGGVPKLDQAEVQAQLKSVKDWSANESFTAIHKHFKFKDFYRTMAFVNAVAWVANNQNHHPDILLGYNYCEVTYQTHATDGLSENDFICAAKIDQLAYL